MTISKEWSIAEDSTSSTPLRRPARTYGRAREIRQAPSSPATDKASYSLASLSIYRTGPHDTTEVVPATSDAPPSNDDDTGETGTKFNWGWRKKLQELDDLGENEDDDETMQSSVPPSSLDPLEPPLTHAISPRLEASGAPTSTPNDVGEVPDVFQTSSQSITSPSSPEKLPRSSLRFRNRPRQSSLPVVHQSDSEKDRLHSSPHFTSPEAPYPINTPNSRASTPPTSDTNAQPVARKPPKKKQPSRKGKRKDIVEDLAHSSASDADHVSRPPKTKHRKLSKKQERVENARERSRAAAAQHVSIPRIEGNKYSIQSFLNNLHNSKSDKAQPSDPIQDFASSPTKDALSTNEQSVAPQVTPLQRHSSDLLQLRTDSDDEALPEVGEMFNAPRQRWTEAAKELAETKRRVLARQAEQHQQGLADDSDDENDLEIVQDMKVVADEETGQRRALKARQTRPSEGRKRQIMLARVNVAQGHRSPSVRKFRDPFEQLKAMVQPTFGVSSRDRRGNGTQQNDKLTPDGLNRMLLKQITETNAKISEDKEAEWVSHGGKASEQLRQGCGDFKQLETAQKVYAERGLKANAVATEHEDESDEEWTPETNESASPSRHESDDEAQIKDDSLNSEDEVMAAIEPHEHDNGEHDDEKAIRGPRRPRRTTKRSRAVQDSDEDDDSQDKPILHNPPDAVDTLSLQDRMPPPRLLPKIIHRPSFSSFEDPTEDETDKENNTILMYDKSEDKENKAVIRHSPGALRRGPLSTKSFKKPRSLSPGVVLSDGDGEVGERTPFKELLDDPFTSPTLRSDIPFATRLRQASSASLVPQPSLAPPPLDLGKAGASFSQFLDEAGNSPPLVAPKLGGLSQAFEFGTESANPTKQTENNQSVLNYLRQPDDLSLTLDVHLQPALEVSENIRRQADSIFEKEQVYVIETARQKPAPKETIYVNDHGFLTQTRPEDVSSPDIYRIASSQNSEPRPPPSVSQLATRHPLRTLSFTQDVLSPSASSENAVPLGRLRRRSASPIREPTGYRSSRSPIPPKRKLDAFQVLARGQAKAEKRSKERMQAGKSEFVETEAQESDEEDRYFGFVPPKKTDGEEDEDGEHLDKPLEDLLDDARMDEDTLATDLVLEKVKEQQEQDDQSLEKYHLDAVEGKFRVKRRNRGFDMDDSDEEDEDDGRVRRQPLKKRKLGEDMESLGKDEATKPFYDAYQRDLIDDDPMEFGPREEEVGPVEGEEVVEETISTAEVTKRVREIAREKFVPPTSNDILWVDGESEDEGHAGIVIKEAAPAKKAPVLPRHALTPVDFDSNLERPKRTMETEHERIRLATWAKAENRSRNLGTARSAAGASVTGHGKARVKAGAGSVRAAQGSSTTNVEDGRRKLSKTSSILAGLADRARRFQQ